MVKQKSRFIGFILAVFIGPLSFLYVKKWKKTLIYLPFIMLPFINIIAYIIILFLIVKDVKKYNIEKKDELRYGLIACKCGNQNPRGSRYCCKCRKPLTNVCNSCQAHIPKGQPYCNICGSGFQEQIKKLKRIRNAKIIAVSTVVILLLISLIH